MADNSLQKFLDGDRRLHDYVLGFAQSHKGLWAAEMSDHNKLYRYMQNYEQYWWFANRCPSYPGRREFMWNLKCWGVW